MVFKFVPVFALLAVAHCRPGLQQVYQAPAAIIQPATLLAQPALIKKEIYDTNPQYNFAYDIKDALTGDIKSQQEILEGGVVKGQYSLLEADGRQRIVNYYADPINGFNADVQYAGVAPQPAATIIKTPIAAPTLIKAAPTLIKTSPALAAPYVAPFPPSLAPAYATALPYNPAFPYSPAPQPALVKAFAGPTVVKASYAVPALAPGVIKTAPVLAYNQSPVLAESYTKTLASPVVSTYTKSFVPPLASAYATALPYGSTSFVKY